VRNDPVSDARCSQTCAPKSPRICRSAGTGLVDAAFDQPHAEHSSARFLEASPIAECVEGRLELLLGYRSAAARGTPLLVFAADIIGMHGVARAESSRQELARIAQRYTSIARGV